MFASIAIDGFPKPALSRATAFTHLRWHPAVAQFRPLRPLAGGEGGGGGGGPHAVTTEPGLPHLTPTLSAPRDGEGGFNKLFYIGSKMCECRSHQGGGPGSALLFVLPPPRWGRVGVGVMRAECVDSVENRSNR